MDQPIIIPTLAGYKLVQDYIYEWKVQGRKFRIIVPKGFLYDGASVPRFLWTMTGITPDGLHRAADLVHDFLYHHKGILPNGSLWEILPKNRYVAIVQSNCSREQADRLFARMLRECGVSKLTRRLMYLGVRLGGGLSWK